MPASPRVTFLLLALAACGESPPSVPPPMPPPPPPGSTTYPAFSVVPADHFAGGAFALRMRGPGVRPFTLDILVDGQRSTMRSLDDSTMHGDLAAGISGASHEIHLLSPIDTTLDPITVHGTTGYNAVRRNLPKGYLSGAVWRRGTGLFLLGTAEGLRHGRPYGMMSLIHGPGAYRMTAPGPSFDPDLWLLRSRPDGPLERWKLSGSTLQLFETLPWTGSGTWQTYADLGIGRLLAIELDEGRILQRIGDSYVTVRRFDLGGAKRIVVSPTGDYAAITAARGTIDPDSATPRPGIPVFRIPEGEIAYTFPNLISVTAVDFSPDGKRLALIGGSNSADLDGMQLRDAATGAFIRMLEVPQSGTPRGVAFDPERPYLYVIAHTRGAWNNQLGEFELQVWSTTDWSLLGRMRGFCFLGCTREILIVPSDRSEVFTVESGVGHEETFVMTTRFTLPM